MAVIGDLVATLSLDNAKFNAGIRESQTSLQKFQSGLGSVGADLARVGQQFALFGVAAGAAFVTLAVKTINAQDKIGDLAAQLGISTRALSELQYAAEQAGSSSENLSSGLETMSKRLGEVAVKGSGAAKDAIERLGLDVETLIKLRPDEAFTRIAEAMKGVESQSERNAIAANIFSRANQSLVNTLALGRDGLAAMRQEARELGISLSQEQVQAAQDAKDAMDRLSSAFTGLANAAATSFAPALLTAADSLTALVKEIPQAISFLGDLRAALGLGGEADTVAGIEMQVDRLKEQLVGLRNQEGMFGEGSQSVVIAQVEAEIASLIARQQELQDAQTQSIIKSDEVAKVAAIEAQSIGKVTESAKSSAAAIKKATAERERQRDAIQAIVAATNPLLAQEKKLISEIAILESAINSERGSTEELTKAKAALEKQLTALRNPLLAVTEAHKANIDQLTAELEAIRGGAGAYDAYLAQKKIEEETQKVINGLLADGHDLRNINTQAIRDQVREEQALITQIQNEKDARVDANSAWEGFLTEILGAFIDSTGSMGDAFADLAERMKREVLNAGVGSVLGLGGGSTPILSGAANLAGGGSLDKLFSGGSLFPKLESNIIGLSNELVAQGGVLADAGLALNNAANNIARLPGGMVGGGLITAGAGFVGGQLGQAVFGGEAGLGSQVGGLGGALLGAQLGALGGPLGALAGSFVGSALDSVLGGDGPEVRAAVFAGADTSKAEPKWVADLRDAASGLKLAGEAQRVGAEGQRAVAGMVDAFAKIDETLTGLTRASGLSVDLSGATGFGSFSAQDMAGSAREFVRAWIDAVSEPFDDELRAAADSLVGDTAEDLINSYQGLLRIRDSIASGGIFAGLGSLQQLSQAISPAQVQQIEAFAAQIGALQQTMNTDSLAVWERSQRSVFELWRDQGDAISRAAEVAASADDFALLTAAVQERYATEQQLIGQIMGALQTAADQFGNSYESIFVDGLKTEQARYEFFRKQAYAVAEMITTLNDPAAISAAATEYNKNLMNAYNSLSEASRDAMRADILATTEQVGLLVEDRLNMALAGIEADGNSDVPGSVANTIEAATERAMEAIRATITDAVETISQQQTETSRQSTDLVVRLNQWADGLPESIRVQLTGTEVSF
jgi:hypothetical protein